MHDRDGRYAGPGQTHRVVAVASQLDPEVPVIGDDKAQIPDLGDIDARVIDFRDDALGDSKPQP